MAAPTHIQSNFSQYAFTNTTSHTVALTGVSAGNLIVVGCSWGGGNGGTVSVSDGITTLTPGTLVAYGTTIWSQVFYLLSANSGNKTYTITFSTPVDYPGMAASEFNAADAWTFDAQNTGNGNGTAISTGNISTTGTSEVTYAFQGNDSGYDPTAQQINGVNATVPALSELRVWYRLLSATFTGGNAAATITTSPWACNLISFKATAASTSITPTIGSLSASGVASRNNRGIFVPTEVGP